MSGRTLFIINPVSAKRHQLDRGILHSIENSDVVDWNNSDDLEKDLSQLNIDKYSRFISVGGDGTINAVINATFAKSRTYGIIPLGSGNGLARCLKVPLSVEGALKIIERDRSMSMDVGLMNDRYFLNVAGMGFDADVAQGFGQTTRGITGYIIEVIRRYFSTHEQIYRVSGVDGKVIEWKAFLISVANGDQWGNEFYIARDARFDDGKLDLVALRKPSLLQIPSLLRALRNKGDHKLMRSLVSEHFQIHRPEEGIVHYDGEPASGEKSIDVQCIPGAIRFIH